MNVRFGPAGVPIQCEGSSTHDGVKCCAELGLSAMEIEFVHGVRMKEDSASQILKTAKELDISISSHAPYYVNLCTSEEQKMASSRRHIYESARITALAGGAITVFHPGFYQKLSKEEAYSRAKARLLEIEEKLKANNIKIRLGAETVGKPAAFGGLDENIRLSQEIEMVEPVIDFAHLIARGDMRLESAEDYRKLFKKLEDELGSYVKRFHSHFSEIEYSVKGERNHLVLGTKHEPPYEPLMLVLAENGYCGTVICESPQIDIDALKMKKEYERCMNAAD
jgi:deoxyribonuclease IV